VLEALHRQFGLAGFFASDNIGSQRRQALLSRARASAAEELERPHEVGPILDHVCRIACDAVEAALGAEVRSDGMHMAHIHTIAARELLQAIGGGLRAVNNGAARRR
jgi:hypothetical protein